MANAGKFEIRVGEGGYPVWCIVMHNGKELCRIRHNELSDLKYCVNKAISEAISALPNKYMNEVG